MILSLLVALAFGLTAAAPANAQEDTVPLGWVANAGPGGVVYPSAEAACVAQWRHYNMDNGYSRFIGVKAQTDDWRRVDCEWTRYQYLCPEENPGAGFLCGTAIPASVETRCPENFLPTRDGYCRLNAASDRPGACSPDGTGEGRANPQVGNPCVLATGAKVLSSTDYASPDGLFRIARHYRTYQVGKQIQQSVLPRDLPRGLDGYWNFEFSREIQFGVFGGTPASPNATVAILMPDGTGYGFVLQNNGNWVESPSAGAGDASNNLKLEFIGALPSDLGTVRDAPSTWRLTDRDDTVWTIETRRGPNGGQYHFGWPTSMVMRSGYSQTFTYASDGSLASVTDSFGRTAGFTWEKQAITTLQSPPSGSKPVPSRVSSVELPDGTSLHYHYEEATPGGYSYGGTRWAVTSFGGSGPSGIRQVFGALIPGTVRLKEVERRSETNALLDSVRYLHENSTYARNITGIVDNRGERVATYDYDSAGRVILTEGAGGARAKSVAYSTLGTARVREVTNELGKEETYTFSQFSAGQKDYRLTGVAGDASANTQASTASLTYGADTFIASATDPEGRIITTTRDARGRPTTIVEASGTPDARTTTISWHPTFNVPVTITTPGLTETRTYDAQGRLETVTLTDITSHSVPYATNGQSRTTSYSWDTNGRLLSVNGPLAATAQGDDITSFTYDAQGNLLTAINAMGHVITYSNFGPDGRAGLMTDGNGIQTAFVYDELGRVEMITLKHPTDPLQDAVTSMTYDAVGNITTLALPGTLPLSFTYDAANRVTDISSPDGEKWTYTYDAMGNVLRETVRRGDGSTFVKLERAFDELGRLIREASGIDPAAAQWAYDRVGNVTATTSPNGFVTAAAFDALDRVVSTVAPDTGTSALTYDPQDNPLSFTDPIAVTTQFTYNGFGEVIEEVSPDRGTSTYWYDAAGQLTQSSDGRGQLIIYERDLLGRVTKVTPQGRPASEVVEYVWDAGGLSGSYGVGQLAQVIDGSGTTSFAYDHRGNLLAKEQAVGTSVSAQLAYEYDSADRVTKITYPSGRQVRYGYDAKGRVASVETRASSSDPVWQVVSSGYLYEPFGPVKAMLLGNGLAVGNVWGPDGALRSRQLTTVATGTDLSHLAYRYDPDGSIGAITDHVTPAASVVYGYDPVGRLVLTVSDTAPIDPQSYSYTSGTNQLAAFTDSSGTRTISYDARGNTISESRPGGITVNAGYDGYGRLTSYDRSNTGLQQYSYNGLDDRVKVVKPTGTRTFVYDANGRVMGEYGIDASDVKAEFIWALPTLAANDNSPFGGGDVTGGYTPLAVASPAGSGPGPVELFWVYGNHLGVPVVYTNASGTPVAPPGDYLLPGFPGQSRVMADLYYNRYRDYDPVTGRYIQADPIGLGGGSNGYIYAGANPVNAIDPDGRLAWWIVPLGFALWEIGSQAYDLWRADCDPSDLSKYRWGDVAFSFGTSLIGGGLGSSAAKYGLSKASNSVKGKVGEVFAWASIKLKGGWVIGPTGKKALAAGDVAKLGTVPGRAGRARPDFVYRTITGKIKVLEAKYSTKAPLSITSGLTGAQRALRNHLGESFEIFRVTLHGAVNAGGVAGSAAAGAAGQIEP